METIASENATATAGREGQLTTDDNKIDMKLSPPGSGGPGTNPEQLFAGGYAACFGQAIKAMAAQEGITPESVTVKTDVHLHKDDSGFFISANINADLPGISQDEAEKLVTMAHGICPYSKATRGNIDVTLQANGNALQAAA